MAEISTKPYLIRAIYEWCTDSGYRPYIAVVVDEHTIVPREFVRNGEIVLNVSAAATNRLHIGNDLLEFEARFGGVARHVSIPIDNVSAIFAQENGHGMAFEVSKAQGPAAHEPAHDGDFEPDADQPAQAISGDEEAGERVADGAHDEAQRGAADAKAEPRRAAKRARKAMSRATKAGGENAGEENARVPKGDDATGKESGRRAHAKPKLASVRASPEAAGDDVAPSRPHPRITAVPSRGKGAQDDGQPRAPSGENPDGDGPDPASPAPKKPRLTRIK